MKRYYEGALLIGSSAGAVQLGLYGWPEDDALPVSLFKTLMLVPFIIGVHEETREWESLKSALRIAGGDQKGIGIPAGGGLIYHPDHTLEPVRYPLYEFSLSEGRVRQNLLLAPDADKTHETSEINYV